MNVDYFKKGKAWLFILLFLIVGVTDARAELQLTDNLLLSGFIRETAVMAIGTPNPDLDALGIDKPRWNLLRTMLQMELNYQPTDIFRFFIKGRAVHDHTYMWQSDLPKYNTTPWMYERHGSDLQTGYDHDNWQMYIWETWINFDTDLFWIRLGKQQIAWGDLPGVRIADSVNPLDKSWHMTGEPEEYEHIRIPEWMARVYFSVPETWTGPFDEVYIDGFWNPGDIHTDIQPAPGSPYTRAYSYKATYPDMYFDYRGDDEYGIRIGFNIANFQASYQYMRVHDDFPWWCPYNNGKTEEDWIGWNPTTAPQMTGYFNIRTHAITLNYTFGSPWNFSMSYEGSVTPNQNWQARYGVNPPFLPPSMRFPGVQEGKFYRNALYLERNFFFLNSLTRFFYPSKIGLMYYRHWIDNDTADLCKLTPASPYPPGRQDWNRGNRLDWAWDMIYLSYTLPFGPGASWQINPKVYWSMEGAYKMQCFLQYSPDAIWRFDVGAMWQGGSAR
jgi:hypothetical protein